MAAAENNLRVACTGPDDMAPNMAIVRAKLATDEESKKVFPKLHGAVRENFEKSAQEQPGMKINVNTQKNGLLLFFEVL